MTPVAPENTQTQPGGVDPAALLLATIAVAVSPVTESGQWYPINTFISAVVGLILVCYIFEPHTKKRTTTLWQQMPASVALGLVIGVGCAWPLQEIAVRRMSNRVGDPLGELTSYWCAPITVLAALVILGLLRRGAGQPSPQNGLTADAHSAGSAMPS